MPDSDGAVHSTTIEEAVAKHRAEIIRFPNGTTTTQGELDDMDPISMRAFINNMYGSSPEEIDQ